ncbi:secA translation cis-regulator SecM [Pasteurella sp. PK-2025]|uniref:secA translation cis-regulator SecM n=1 Tax=unclassified Pasteurella TaxID=2621516 RepID=UPI003C771338
MISRKGKHNFWSQLLLSMIAILALPDASGLPQQANVANENYQTLSVQQQFLRAVALVQQVQKQQLAFIAPVPDSPSILVKITPHFQAEYVHLIPPIRAGPDSISISMK